MAKQRIVDTKFWDDSYIAGLSPLEKLVFLYLITNPLTNISGVYELPLKRAAFDVGMSGKELDTVFKKFEKDGKLVRFKSWIGVVNFTKYQNIKSPTIKEGILKGLRLGPKEVVDRVSIDHQALGISHEDLSHLNLNLNQNLDLNLKGLPLGKLSTAQAEEIRKGKEALGRQYRVR